MLVVVGHRQRLRKALGLVIHPAWANGIHVPPIALWLGMDLRVAIHLAGRGEQVARPLRHGKPQGVVRAERPHFEGLDRQIEVIHRAGGRGKVQHGIQWPLHMDIVCNVLSHECKVLVGFQVGNVAQVTRHQVVHCHHIVPLGQEAVHQMGAQEASTACDQYSHGCPYTKPLP